MPDNGWNEWGKHVLKELEQNELAHEKVLKKLEEIQIDVAKLKVKSGMWGALGGALLALPMVVISWLNTNK